VFRLCLCKYYYSGRVQDNTTQYSTIDLLTLAN
jgi:hypothetical protein